MSPKRRDRLRRIMKMAWGFFRSAAARAQPYGGFGEALRSAWRFVRDAETVAQELRQGGTVYLSPTLIQSPIERVLGPGSLGDFRAAYVTARLGG